MAGKALQISSPFPSTFSPPPAFFTWKPPTLLPLRAAAGDDKPAEQDASAESPAAADPSFDKRLNQIRLKYRSGTGKKAEQRKARKAPSAGSSGKKKGSVLLPPVPLREPMAVGGVPVEVGFTPYSERLNGRLAGLGLAALLLVELGSGKGLLRYHAPAVIFIQIYTVAAAGALFIKFEKERISVWPEKPPVSSSAAASGD
ncbi:hypothetical protein OPV22_017170 [Ensete ventricosum]|uniref:Immunophilin-like n=1 Tax=Ensete ventricosum TaxID=4639 RepID=A0AAV8QT75_ENSVE|nr:hypothetical protein OPV22_017170 [Ensete ventricosum]